MLQIPLRVRQRTAVATTRAGVATMLLLPVALGLFPAAASAQDDPAQEIILERVEQLRSVGELTIRDQWIAAVGVVTELYENRDFRRAWTDSRALGDLRRAVLDMELDGLDPDDYHRETLAQLYTEILGRPEPDPEALADFDMLATDALARLIYHSSFGKVDPEQLDPHWNLARQLEGVDPGEYIQRMIDSGGLYQEIEQLKPHAPLYTGLKQALAKYREIEAAGGWPLFPDGPSIEAGTSDPRVPILRQQLTVIGDYDGPHSDGTVYDEALVEAVKRFQSRHGLPQTGLVGSQTMAALSVPVEDRIDQLRINMERGRWVLHEVPETFLVVNIAAFEVYFMRNGELTWRSRAQVGRTYRKTPVFKEELRYLDINPTWTVPRTIFERDILPKVKEDPSYLQTRGLRVLDRNGDEVDAASLDWSRYNNAASFPYLLRQDPGPANALGRIKFMFPNKYAVYLHDTPSRNLFERSERAFSSGCVRIENPFELAELLLDDPDNWSMEQLLAVKDSRETKSIFLKEQIPVLLLYWTAYSAPASAGALHFRQDIYERDARILAGLNGEFTLRDRPVVGAVSQ